MEGSERGKVRDSLIPSRKQYAYFGSILLSVIVTKTPYHEGVGLSFLGNQDIRSLGDLCFVQLSELRHRGAFSTVAHAFASCCARCMNVKAQELEGFVLGWYNVCRAGRYTSSTADIE